MHPTPSPRPGRREAGPSIQRLNIEYDGWWMSSGVPNERRIAIASPVRTSEVPGDTHVEGLALERTAVSERTHGLFERSVRVVAVVVEDVDVVEPEPAEALVEAGQQVLAGPEIAVGPGPHVPAGLGRDDELVVQAPPEVRAEDRAEVGFALP